MTAPKARSDAREQLAQRIEQIAIAPGQTPEALRSFVAACIRNERMTPELGTPAPRQAEGEVAKVVAESLREAAKSAERQADCQEQYARRCESRTDGIPEEWSRHAALCRARADVFRKAALRLAALATSPRQPEGVDVKVEGLPLQEVIADADRLAEAGDFGHRTDAASIVDTLRRLAKYARRTLAPEATPRPAGERA